MMVEALEDMEEGVLVGGQLVTDVRFADDQGMVAGTEMGLQRLMNKLNDTAKNFGMKINVQKTKTMVVRWDGGGVHRRRRRGVREGKCPPKFRASGFFGQLPEILLIFFRPPEILLIFF